jgi:hypothetical protein
MVIKPLPRFALGGGTASISICGSGRGIRRLIPQNKNPKQFQRVAWIGGASQRVIHLSLMYHLRPRLQERYCGVARPSYLSRRPDGRYYIQLRLGKTAAAIYGRPLFRASLRTSNFQEARRRLVENLEWVMEIVQAPDLEALGEILRHRLGVYVVDGAPGTERRLA